MKNVTKQNNPAKKILETNICHYQSYLSRLSQLNPVN